MIIEFQYSFSELGIVAEDIHKIMGFEKGQIADPFPGYIELALSEAQNLCDIK